MYKRLIIILLLSIACIGCTSKISKTPDNFDKDLWQDSTQIINIIYSAYDNGNNFLVEEERVIKQYFEIYENRVYDNIDENKLISRIKKVYNNYKDYILSKKLNLSLEEGEAELEKSLSKLKELQDKLVQ